MHHAIQDVSVSSRKSFMSKGTNCTKDVMHKYSPEFKFCPYMVKTHKNYSSLEPKGQ